jgi:hypothetical protein
MFSRDKDITLFAAKLQPDGSYINKYGHITWYNEKGQVHKEDGPAVIIYRGKSYWYINGYDYTFIEWLIKLNKPDEEAMLLRLQYDF